MTTTYEYRSEFMRNVVGRAKAEGRAEGEALGEARAVLTVLEARGLEVSSAVYHRILECTDLDLLEVWVRRAVTAATVDELFTEG